MDPTLVADLIHGGGVVALAVIVWMELKRIKPVLDRIVARMDAEDKAKAEDAAATKAAAAVAEKLRDDISGVHRAALGDDDDTPVDSPRIKRDKPRAPSSPYYYGPAKKGDKDR